jgi:hypothetical protein
VSVTSFVNDYSEPIDFGVVNPADMITSALGMAYRSEYIGSIIRDIDTLFYYNKPLESNSTLYLIREQMYLDENAESTIITIFQ